MEHAAEAAGHAHAGLLADPRTWVGLAFILFFVLFGRKVWAALTSTLDTHTNRIRRELDEASRLRREAEHLLRDATSRRQAAEAEARTMLANAQAEATRVAEAARQDAAQAATRRERMAMDRIAAAEKAALTEVRQAAADVATRAAQTVLTSGFAADADAQAVDRAIAGLPNALSGRRAA